MYGGKLEFNLKRVLRVQISLIHSSIQIPSVVQQRDSDLFLRLDDINWIHFNFFKKLYFFPQNCWYYLTFSRVPPFRDITVTMEMLAAVTKLG